MTGTPVSVTDPQSAPTNGHLSDPWCRLRLRSLRQIETLQGVAWSARIVHDGAVVGWVEDGGEGGPLLVRWTDPLAERVARETAERLAGQIGRWLGDPVDNFLEQLGAVHDLQRRRVVLWRVPSQDGGSFWDRYRFRSFPAHISRAEAISYLQHPARVAWQAELWDAGRAWWVPVADLV